MQHDKTERTFDSSIVQLRSFERTEIDTGSPGTSTEDKTRIAELEKEVREPRWANAILKSAPAFFAAELDRPKPKWVT